MNLIEKALQKTTDTKALVIGKDAMKQTPKMFKDLFGDKTAVVVADNNTWKAAGETVYSYLKDAGIPMIEPFIFDDPDLYAEWTFVEQLEAYLKDKDAIGVAVGSGVINDLTKYVSSVLGRKYMIVGTAASMDGYTAYGASITKDGNKQTFDCPAPLGMILDPAVAAKAPKGMSASGYADLIAKVPAGADWMLAEAIGSETVDEFSFGLVQEPLRKSLSEPDAVAAGEVGPTELLSEGLIMSGFAMQAYQSSRPASGLEHQFSHYWDMEALSYPDGKHVSHGFKVGIGTLVSTACLEFLLNYDVEGIDIDKCVEAWPSWEQMQKQIETVFAGKPGHLARGLKETKGKYVDKDGLRKQLEALKAAWPELKEKMKKQIYSFDEVYDYLKRVGAPYECEQICVTKERLGKTFDGIQFMRSRVSSIDILQRLGLLKEAKAYLISKNLMK
ncbi:MAG: sn-glycerol-1-phosphate dehydrogenase [Bacteroidales bacterium]|nr:sn-glycerol-1-phosphate dehydrogenase [Bacteroidales bacterium]